MIRNFTDGSKGERGVGAGVLICFNNELSARHKFRLNHRFSKNQAEQLAIVKALDLINYLEIGDNKPRNIGLYTDGRITIHSLKYAN